MSFAGITSITSAIAHRVEAGALTFMAKVASYVKPSVQHRPTSYSPGLLRNFTQAAPRGQIFSYIRPFRFNSAPALRSDTAMLTQGTMQATRSYSTESNDKQSTTVSRMFLEHQPLTGAEKQALKKQLGEEAFNSLSGFRHRQGLCHTDTTTKMIELAGRQPAKSIEAAAGFADKYKWSGPLLGEMTNKSVIIAEMARGNLQPYTMTELLEKGVPSDSIGVVISAHSGVIDPNSKQAEAGKAMYQATLEPSSANHAIVVLKVENGQVHCFDADPYRGNADPFFKTDVDTFRESVKPRLLAGVVVVPKADQGERV
jgi:hypothetical protein